MVQTDVIVGEISTFQREKCCYAIKAMDNVQRASIQFGMHLDSWESTYEARAPRALPAIFVHPELDRRTLGIVHSLKGGEETEKKLKSLRVITPPH